MEERSGSDVKEITFIVYGPIGQACWKLFAICDFGNGGVCQREATADWVVTRLYGYHSARTFVKVCPPTYPNYQRPGAVRRH